MTDTTFRTKVEPTVEPEVKGKETTSDGESKVEVPYTDYEKQNNHPFVVDHYQLGDTWKEDLGGFEPEVTLIEEFISDKINKGEIPNNVNAVKEAIKKIEKLTNIDKNERSLVKIETVAEYVKFLMKVDKIHFNINRYANH